MAVPRQKPGSLHHRAAQLKTRLSDYKMAGEPEQSGHVSPDRASRSSFSSIREQVSDLGQTFTKSSTSHLDAPEEAIDDSATDKGLPPSGPSVMGVAHFQLGTTTQHSATGPHRDSDLVYPADSFKGWKLIHVRGKVASKSFSDIQRLTPEWTSHAAPTQEAREQLPAPLERLPTELLSAIIDLLVLDVPPNGLAKRNADLVSLLVVSRRMHAATLGSLYQKITFPHSRIFQKFLTFLRANPHLGEAIRRLDFCHFNPSHTFSTAAERAQARNLTAETLLECLELTPGLQEFLGQEYIDDDLDASVLQKLFLGLPRLMALDFCGCSSTTFKTAFSAIITSDWPAELSIRRLSLHKCLTIPTAALEAILSRLPRLTHLDVAGTRVTDSALASIPKTASITHLNLAKCSLLTASGVKDFLAKHPSVSKLVFLSLATDVRSYQLLDMEDVSALLPLLPKTLKSLSLKGSKMHPCHIELLRPHTKHLEELAMGRGLGLEDINRLFAPDEDCDAVQAAAWVPHNLKYIDLSDLWVNDIDFGYLFGRTCALLSPWSEPLEVIEVSSQVHTRFSKSSGTLDKMGWKMTEIGSRSWVVRNPSKSGPHPDGRRTWKMGAESWGMRKIPVAQADVGGMYGNFMFGRTL